MTKEMIFKISKPLQEKIANEYAELVSKPTGIENSNVLRALEFSRSGFTLNYDMVQATPQQKEMLKQINKMDQISRLFYNRDFSLGKPEEAKMFRFDAQRLEQMKQAKKDNGFQR